MGENQMPHDWYAGQCRRCGAPLVGAGPYCIPASPPAVEDVGRCPAFSDAPDLRDEFAKAALVGIMAGAFADPASYESFRQFAASKDFAPKQLAARLAYAYADAMLAERRRQPGPPPPQPAPDATAAPDGGGIDLSPDAGVNYFGGDH